MAQASWAAVKSRDRAEVLSRIGFVETGKIDTLAQRHFVCAQLGDWVVLAGRDLDCINPSRLDLLSAGGHALGCQVSLEPTHAGTIESRAGKTVWVVTHVREFGADNLDVSGPVPAELDTLRANAATRRAADPDGQDYAMFSVPPDLVEALSGYGGFGAVGAPNDTVFYEIEPRALGAGAARQARTRALCGQLTERVERDLYGFVETLGFETVAGRPQLADLFRHSATATFMRERGEWSESLLFDWGYDDGYPFVEILFFVRRGLEKPVVRRGTAEPKFPRRNVLQRLRPRREDPTARDRVISEMRDVLVEVDDYLKHGTLGARVFPVVEDKSA